MHLSSLAGAQLKMSVIRSGERLTLPARGSSGELIAKLPERTFENICENEYLMMRWAAAAGLEVPAVELVAAGRVPQIFDTVLEPSSLVYLVTRFDRGAAGVKIHIEDFAQVTNAPPALRDRRRPTTRSQLRSTNSLARMASWSTSDAWWRWCSWATPTLT